MGVGKAEEGREGERERRKGLLAAAVSRPSSPRGPCVTPTLKVLDSDSQTCSQDPVSYPICCLRLYIKSFWRLRRCLGNSFLPLFASESSPGAENLDPCIATCFLCHLVHTFCSEIKVFI